MNLLEIKNSTIGPKRKTNPMPPLTPEQQAKYSQNLGIPYALAKKYRPPVGWDQEDWVQEVLLTFAKAVAHHDEAKGALTTYADRWVKNRWGTENIKRKTYKCGFHATKVSITTDDIDGKGIGNLIVGRPDPRDNALTNGEYSSYLLRCVDDRAAKAFRLIAEGLSYREIGRELGVSRQRIGVIVAQARDWIAELFPEDLPEGAKCRACSLPFIPANGAIYCGDCAEWKRNLKKLRHYRRRVARKKRRVRCDRLPLPLVRLPSSLPDGRGRRLLLVRAMYGERLGAGEGR